LTATFNKLTLMVSRPKRLPEDEKKVMAGERPKKAHVYPLRDAGSVMRDWLYTSRVQGRGFRNPQGRHNDGL